MFAVSDSIFTIFIKPWFFWFIPVMQVYCSSTVGTVSAAVQSQPVHLSHSDLRRLLNSTDNISDNTLTTR